MSINNKIALGTVQFGLPYGISNKTGQTSFEEVSKILDLAYNKGINTLDTAFGYGKSESVLGKLNQNRFNIVTKFLPENLEGKIQNQFNTSLERLKTDNVYGYLAHRPLDVLDNNDVWDYLIHLKETKMVEKIGFSFNEPKEYFLLKEKGFMPDLVQVPFNYFDNRFVKVLEDLKKNNCEIHTRSTFLQGLFFMNPKNLSNHFSEVKPFISDLQEEFKTNLAGALLNYVLSFELIDKVVLGVQNSEQLTKNLESLENTLELKQFSEKIDDSILQPSKWNF